MNTKKPKATKDHLIEQLINDPAFDVRADGTIFTRRQRYRRRNPADGPWRKIGTLTRGYMTVWYSGHNLLAHRIVFRKFAGPLDAGLEINHKNGVKKDNRIENLELVTSSENVRHRFAVLGHKGPKTKNAAKIDQDTADAIRAEYAAGKITQPVLSGKYDLSLATISRVIRDLSWAPSKPALASKYIFKIDQQVADAIRAEYAMSGNSQTVIAAKYGLHQTTIYGIVNGRISKTSKTTKKTAA